MDSFLPIEIIGVEVKLNKKILNFFSIYIPPISQSVKPYKIKEEATKLFKYLEQFNNIFVGGDFNSHSKTWNSYKTDQFGR
jgi:hypothetical protein